MNDTEAKNPTVDLTAAVVYNSPEYHAQQAELRRIDEEARRGTLTLTKSYDPFLDMGDPEVTENINRETAIRSIMDDLEYAEQLAGSETPATVTLNHEPGENPTQFFLVWHFYDGNVQIDTWTIAESTPETTA